MLIKTNHPFWLFLLIVFPAIAFSQNKSSFIERMAQGADLIITGKVVEQNSAWNSDKTSIYTNVTIRVDEYIKGQNTRNDIVITHPGGEVGDVGELYTHVPTFRNDEEILLFVKKNVRTNYYEVFQGESGKFTLSEDKVTGEKKTSQNWKVDKLKEEIKLSLKN